MVHFLFLSLVLSRSDEGRLGGREGWKKPGKCFGCGKEGHLIYACPLAGEVQRRKRRREAEDAEEA